MRRIVAVLAALVAAAVAASATRGAADAFPRDGVLVVAFGSDGLHTIRSDGQWLRQLASGGCDAEGCDAFYGPSWSPDGQELVFARRLNGVGEIWRGAADGSRLRPLTAPLTGEDSEPAWSPRGGRIAFVRALPQRVGGNLATIWVMSADGSRPRMIARGPLSYVRPSWSPDGKRIAFNDVRERVYVVSANGGRPRRLAGVSGRNVRWSPDGRRLAMVTIGAGAGAAIRTFDLGTRRVRTLASHHAQNFEIPLTWSPDGCWLAYTVIVERQRAGFPTSTSEGQLWLLRAADGRRKAIRRGEFGEIYGLDWRPRATRRL